MADEAVLDSPVLEAPEVDVSPVETPEVSEAAPVDSPEGDNRTLPAWIKNLKANDPTGYAEARKDFFSRVNLEKKLNGFDVDATRPWLEERGGVEGLTQTLSELEAKSSEYDAMLQDFSSGNASAVISRMLEASPEGFAKLAPQMDAQWMQNDPEGWQASRAATFDATIQQSGFLGFLKDADRTISWLARAVGENQPAQELITELRQYVAEFQRWGGSFKDIAAKQGVNQAQPKDDQKAFLAEKAQFVQERFQSKVEPRLASFRESEIANRVKDFTAKEPDNADKRQRLNEITIQKVINRLNGDDKLQTSLRSFVQKGDAENFYRLITSREKAAIEDIAPKEAAILYGPLVSKPAPKPAVAPVTRAPLTATTPSSKFDEIFERARRS